MINPQLQTFVRVADAGSFSKAAQEQYISTTAVAKQINLLEKRMGFSLFDRHHTGLTLTKAGKVFYVEAKAMLAHSEAVMQKCRKLDEKDNRTIRMGTNPDISDQFLIDLWPRILETNPDLKLERIPCKSVPNFDSTLDEAVDVMPTVYGQSFGKDGHLGILHLAYASVRAGVSINSTLALKPMLEESDLLGRNILICREGVNESVDSIRSTLIEKYGDSLHLISVDAQTPSEEVSEWMDNGALAINIDFWGPSYPMRKMLPVRWNLKLPIGLCYHLMPRKSVQRYLAALAEIING